MQKPDPQPRYSATLFAIASVLIVIAGAIGVVIGRTTAPVPPVTRDDTALREVRSRLDSIDEQLANLANVPRTIPPQRPNATTPPESVDLSPVLERIDALYARIVPENLDQIPDDVRVPKQTEEVDRLDSIAAERLKEVQSELFGLTRSQVYQRLGQPDAANPLSNGMVNWSYFSSSGLREKALEVVFVGGMVNGVY